MTTTPQDVEQAEARVMFSAEAPSGSQWFDPSTMTHRQRAVVMSMLGEPDSRILQAEPHLWASIIDSLHNGTKYDGDPTLLDDGVRGRFHYDSIMRVFRELDRHDIYVVVRGDTTWPAGLGGLGEHAPVVLYVRGNPWALSDGITLAVVGARASTGYGDHVTSTLVDPLASDGYTIISGGAYGIDAAAHRVALAAGGRTIVYLAGGVDREYPVGNASLFARIIDAGGALVSELPPGSAPTRWRFLQRNRLIAAHAKATVVVESGARGGSKNIAAHAEALGRPLGAVPGPITSPASTGCHQLIAEGASIIQTHDDLRALVARAVV